MPTYDRILKMLDWNNPQAVQDEGIRLARECEEFSAFIQPSCREYNKNVWDNCAKLICEKSDSELQPYIPQLLEWTQDLNWPGAISVFERLKSCGGEVFVEPFLQTVRAALRDKEKNEEWLYHLSAYIRRPDIYKALNETERSLLEKMYACFWRDDNTVRGAEK